ncbi:MAG: hypothetical protein M1828_007032 [Chrysothrix sp. TS-e1954]|nr:MAG: hypothetical protein M1828_007032 [Chrysothrix sp. TS-e1954]
MASLEAWRGSEEYIQACEEASRHDELEDQPPSPPLPPSAIAIGKYTHATHHRDGLFSFVYKARAPTSDSYGTTSEPPETSRFVALKVTTPSMMEPPHDAEREARILAVLSGSSKTHIIPLLDTFKITGSRFVLAFPFLAHDFSDLLATGTLSKDQICSTLYDLFTGLEYLHEHSIIHRDIKPPNILLHSRNGPAYLSDFGIAWSPTDAASEAPNDKITDVGTTCYRPPELLLGHESYGASLDMWAAGCVVAEAVGGRGPEQRSLFDAGDLGSELALVKSIFSSLGTPTIETWPEVATFRDWGKMTFREYPAQPWDVLLPEASKEARDLVSQLVRYESGERLEAVQALEHAYFTNFQSTDNRSETNARS